MSTTFFTKSRYFLVIWLLMAVVTMSLGACPKQGRYDRYGYDQEGYDKQGYNVNGFNRFGIHRLSRSIFDPQGFDKDGYDFNGFNRNGIHRITKTNIDLGGFNKEGYDEDGFDRNGNDRDGYDRGGYHHQTLRDRRGFSRAGFYQGTFHRHDPRGFDQDGIHRDTLTEYDLRGFNIYGIHNVTGNEFGDDERDVNGYSRLGFLPDGTHRNGSLYDDNGFNCYDRDRHGFNPQQRHINGSLHDDNGFAYNGIHRDTNELYDQLDLDIDRNNRAGFNFVTGLFRDGTLFDGQGYDINGFNANDKDRQGFDYFGYKEINGRTRDRNGADEYGFLANGSHLRDNNNNVIDGDWYLAALKNEFDIPFRFEDEDFLPINATTIAQLITEIKRDVYEIDALGRQILDLNGQPRLIRRGFIAANENFVTKALKRLYDSLQAFKKGGIDVSFRTDSNLNNHFKINPYRVAESVPVVNYSDELRVAGRIVPGFNQATLQLPLSFYEGIFNEIVMANILPRARYFDAPENAYNNDNEAKKNSIRKILQTIAKKDNNTLLNNSPLKINIAHHLHDINYPSYSNNDFYIELQYKLLKTVAEIVLRGNDADLWLSLTRLFLHGGEHCDNAKYDAITDAYKYIAEDDAKRLEEKLSANALSLDDKIKIYVAKTKYSILYGMVEEVLIDDNGDAIYEASSKRVKTWNTVVPLIGLPKIAGPEYLASLISPEDFKKEFFGEATIVGRYIPSSLRNILLTNRDFLIKVKQLMSNLDDNAVVLGLCPKKNDIERFIAEALLLKHRYLITK